MQKDPAFFDWRGELSRLEYLKSVIYRMAFLALFLLFSKGLHYMYGLASELDHSDALNFALKAHNSDVVGFALFVPIDIRRARDAGLSIRFVALIWALTLVPSPPDLANSLTKASYSLFIFLPMIALSLILFLKPGRAFRERSQSTP